MRSTNRVAQPEGLSERLTAWLGTGRTPYVLVVLYVALTSAWLILQPFSTIAYLVTFNDEGDRDPATYFVFEVANPDPANWGQNTVAAEIEQAPPQ